MWMSSDEMDDTMMGAAKTVFCENRIGLGGEVTIGEEQQLDPLADRLLMQEVGTIEEIYVSHVDLSRNLWHYLGVF